MIEKKFMMNGSEFCEQIMQDAVARITGTVEKKNRKSGDYNINEYK